MENPNNFAPIFCQEAWMLAKIIQLATDNFCANYFTRENDKFAIFTRRMCDSARSVPAKIAESSRDPKCQIDACTHAQELFGDFFNIFIENGELPWRDENPERRAILETKIVPARANESFFDVMQQVVSQKAKFDAWLRCEDLLVRANALLVLCARELEILHRFSPPISSFEKKNFVPANDFRKRVPARQNAVPAGEGDASLCPKCGAPMVLRTAKQGPLAGKQFWSCKNFRATGCKGTRPFKEA